MALTVVSDAHSVWGDLRVENYVITVAETGDTLTTGLKIILGCCTNNPGAVTNMAITNASGTNSVATVVITTTGAVTKFTATFWGY